ncbi:MAG: ABC transporter permease [Bacteroidota bacterium]
MNTHTPPSWPEKFLKWFCKEELVEGVLGDLEEMYFRNQEKSGKHGANLIYLWHVMLFFQPFAFRKNNFSSFLMHTLMFRHFLKIGWRILLRQKWYSIIKIGGFAMAILACMLISLFIRQELTYDQHYDHQDQIYRIVRMSMNFDDPTGPKERGAHFPMPFPQTIKNEYPDFEEVGSYNSVRSFGAGSNEIRIVGQTNSFHENELMYVDQGLLNILEVPFFLGDAEHALEQPNSIVLSRSRARKYFGAANPIGKNIILNNEEETIYTITGVIQDPLPTSHLKMEFVITLSEKEFYKGERTNWRNSNYPTYVRIHKGREIASLEEAINHTIEKYFIPASEESNSPEAKKYNESLELELQSVDEIYMNHTEVWDGLPHGDIRYIWLFGSIGAFILIIALINFINLSTARSANRAKEVGLRKTLGTQRGSLITQFLTESFLICLFSFGIALLMLVLLLPLFNAVSSLSLSIPWEDWWVIPIIILMILGVSLLAGMYPSFYLSAFQPVEVLKGNLSRGSNSKHVRNGLVIFQFAVTVVLLAATWIIDKQMGYMLNKKLGYEKEQVLLLHGAHTLGEDIYTLKTELKRIPGIEEVGVSGFLPIENTSRNGNGFFLPENQQNEDLHIGGQRWTVDHDYLTAMGMKVLQGRNFDVNVSADSQAVIINQSMVKALHLENPIGKQIANNWNIWTVIGVVEDFHFENMREDIDPLLFHVGRSTRSVIVKLETENMASTLDEITETWDTFSPQQSIRYAFLDESFELMFTDVKRIGQLFKGFTILAIVIACLGLLALSAFIAEQRSKEIGIRKVLGATVSNIVSMLSADFLKLVMIATLVAIPVAWWGMNQWLSDFAYRTQLSWSLFFWTGILALVLAFLTISFQSVKAALANPVDSLRNE